MADASRARRSPAGRAGGSDLAMRTASAAVMLVVSGFALWLGGMAWTVFVLIVGLAVWFEWRVLVLLGVSDVRRRNVWQAVGAIYCGIACAVLLVLRPAPFGLLYILLITLAVIATDVGAYFAGRAIGGPRIAPAISPGKTWAGLIGGMIASALAVLGFTMVVGHVRFAQADQLAPIGVLVAMIAQAGDFFESWMKRRAGVKDSGTLLPGHGGVFDRLDGLLAVLFVLGIALPVVQIARAGAGA